MKKTTKDIVGDNRLVKSGMNMGENPHIRYFYINVYKPCSYEEFMKLETYDDYRLNLMHNFGFQDWWQLW